MVITRATYIGCLDEVRERLELSLGDQACLKRRNHHVVAETHERWLDAIETAPPGRKEGLHDFFLAAPGNGHATSTLAPSEYRVLCSAKCGTGSIFIHHFHEGMTHRFSLTVEEDVNQANRVTKPSYNGRWRDILAASVSIVLTKKVETTDLNNLPKAHYRHGELDIPQAYREIACS